MIDNIASLVNADAKLIRRGCFVDTTFMIAIDDAYTLIRVQEGRIVKVTPGPFSNTASRDGGGLYANGGQINLFNPTIANNHVVVPLGTFYAGMGGGVYITATAVVTAQNMLLGDNTRHYGANLPEPDDCFASVSALRSLGYNLIETPDNCLISGTTFGNITGQDPILGPLQNNGGSAQTQSPLLGSPAIDAIPVGTNGCGTTLTSDQRGASRPANGKCDIGAVEYSAYVINLPLILR